MTNTGRRVALLTALICGAVAVPASAASAADVRAPSGHQVATDNPGTPLDMLHDFLWGLHRVVSDDIIGPLAAELAEFQQAFGDLGH